MGKRWRALTLRSHCLAERDDLQTVRVPVVVAYAPDLLTLRALAHGLQEVFLEVFHRRRATREGCTVSGQRAPAIIAHGWEGGGADEWRRCRQA